MSKVALHFTGPRTILADVVPLRMPFSIQVEVSQICNLKCNYCIHGITLGVRKEMMKLSTFAKMCRQILDFGGKLKTVNFAGWGEPLVNPLLPQMIELLRFQDITENVAIITNGVLLTPGVTNKLLDVGVNQIRISLQGMTDKKYEEICGRTVSIDRIIQNVSYLFKQRECFVYVKIADIALDPGDEDRFYKTFEPITDAMYVEKVRPMFAENVQDGKTISKYGDEHPPVIACPQPFFMMSVLANGDILPCCSYYDPIRLGNVDNWSLKGIWGSESMRLFREMLLSDCRKEQEAYPVCKTCHMPDAVITPGDELDERAEEIRGRL